MENQIKPVKKVAPLAERLRYAVGANKGVFLTPDDVKNLCRVITVIRQIQTDPKVPDALKGLARAADEAIR